MTIFRRFRNFGTLQNIWKLFKCFGQFGIYRKFSENCENKKNNVSSLFYTHSPHSSDITSFPVSNSCAMGLSPLQKWYCMATWRIFHSCAVSKCGGIIDICWSHVWFWPLGLYIAQEVYNNIEYFLHIVKDKFIFTRRTFFINTFTYIIFYFQCQFDAVSDRQKDIIRHFFFKCWMYI